jgi:intracellular septation protein A
MSPSPNPQPMVNVRIFASMVPVGVFYLVSRVGESWQAIVAGFIASAIVFWYTRKDRLIGALTAFGFLVVAVSAVIGIIWDSEKAYLASGPVADFLFVPLYLGSIVIGRPLIGGIARELFPAVAASIPPRAALFNWLSAAWAMFDVFHGVFRIYLLRELSVGEYIIWSRLLFWPFSAAMIGVTAWLIFREAKRLAPEDEGGLRRVAEVA